MHKEPLPHYERLLGLLDSGPVLHIGLSPGAYQRKAAREFGLGPRPGG